MSARIKVRMLVVPSLLTASLLALTACQPEPSGVESLKGEGDVTQQVEGETTWGNDDGPEYVPNLTLPESFPRDAIPLASGEIVDTGERAPGVWFVNITAPDAAAVDSALTLLTQAGFQVNSDQAAGADRAVTLQNDRYDINFLSIAGDGTITLSYDISTRS